MFTVLMIMLVTTSVLGGIAGGTALYFWGANRELQYRASEKIADLHREKFELNKSWEEGMDDQQESYEMQLLTLQERYNDLEGEKNELQKVVIQHEEWCLPTLKSPFR